MKQSTMKQTTLWTEEEMNPNTSRAKEPRVRIPINILNNSILTEEIHKTMEQLQYVHTVRELVSVPGFLSWHSTLAAHEMFVEVHAIYKVPQTGIYIKAIYQQDSYTISTAQRETREFLEFVEGSAYHTDF